MTRDQMLALLKLMLAQFEADPPDTEFQEGYHAALLEVRRWVVGQFDCNKQENGFLSHARTSLSVDDLPMQDNQFEERNMLPWEGAMRLPEIADRLRELAIRLNCDELNILAAEIGRRSSRYYVASATKTEMQHQLQDRHMTGRSGR